MARQHGGRIEWRRWRMRWVSLLVILVSVALTYGPTHMMGQTPGRSYLAICPGPGKWSLTSWLVDPIDPGPYSANLSWAVTTCYPRVIDVAFAWDYDSQGWIYWIAGAEDSSTLHSIAVGYPVFLHGSESAMPMPTPVPT